MSSKKGFHELRAEMRPKVRFWVPAAAMDEDDLRQEIRNLHSRGFGGVEVVVLATLPPEIAWSEDGWGTENWDRMVAVIDDETQKLGMSMDLANGPGWPMAFPTVLDADDPASLYELTWGVMDVEKGTHYHGPLPERRTVREEGKPELLHVLAYLEKSPSVLIRNSYMDLRDKIREGILDVSFPDGEGACWKVFTFYGQPAAQKVNAAKTYTIDHLSKSGVKACEAYWDEVFGKNRYSSMESFFCDSLEYDAKLDWSREFPGEFERRRGYSILPYLPFIGLDNTYPPCDIPGFRLDDADISDGVNRDYLETLTQCYCEYHLAGLETLAQKYGKTVRYQVAYNKPFEGERCGLYVSIPENEALGRPFLDGLRMMAAAAHLGRKERYSFECAAEFGHSYGQDHEDLFWWVKRSLMAGMNAQVLHGASYSGAYYGGCAINGTIPGTEWPGYEGFGKVVSNYWNRTLSESDARGCLDAITRLNTVFRKQAKVDCAIFRCSYSNDGLGSEHALYPDGGALLNRGYSYETVSDALLHLPVCKVTNGQLDEEGVGYRCLIVPEQKAVSASFLKKAAELAEAGLPVIWVGRAPESCLFYSECLDTERQSEWECARDAAWSHPRITHVASIEEVPNALLTMQIRPRVELEGKSDLMTALREDGDQAWIGLYRYNRVEFSPQEQNPEELAVSALYKKGSTKGSYERPGESSLRSETVRLTGKGQVYLCDYWTGEMRPLPFREEAGSMVGTVDLQEDELKVLCLCREEAPSAQENAAIIRHEGIVTFKSLELHSFEPDREGEISFLRSGMKRTGEEKPLAALLPWKDLDPALRRFSGEGIYRGLIRLDAKHENSRYILHLGNVSDTFAVCVNGCETRFPDQVLKQVEVGDLLRTGENTLEVRVTSNLYNRLFEEDMSCWGFPLPYKARKYGIWEEPGKTVYLEEQAFEN